MFAKRVKIALDFYHVSDRFAAVPFEDRGGYFQGRYYQDIAIDRVLVHSDPLAVLVLTNTKGECMLAGRQCVDRVL